MKKAGIFYMSGTGNTKAIAELFVKYFGTRGFECDLVAIDDHLKNKGVIEDMTQYDFIGVGSPIYGSNAVPLVEDFVKGLCDAHRFQKAFVFLTGADYIAINQGASYTMRDALQTKGYHVVLDKIYPMGSNWCMKYDDDMSWQLYLANERKIAIDVERVLDGRSVVDKKRWFPALCAYLGKAEHWGAKILSKGFAFNEQCVDCGKCLRDCPVSNISKNAQGYAFGKDCVLCMKCLYNCPASAIYLKKYKFMAVEGGYAFDKIKANGMLTGTFLTPATKGYYKHFYEYVKEGNQGLRKS